MNKEWTCDIDIPPPVLTPAQQSAEVMVFSTSTNTNPLPTTAPDTEPVTKRSRLTSIASDKLVFSNGISGLHQKQLVSDSAAVRLGLSDRFKVTFCAHFKNALKEKLGSYFGRLDKAEESTNKIQKELAELSDRMNAIDTSSQELKKFITERVSLPKPTSGVGHHRTLSSQAPRLPPPPPLAPASDTVTDTSTTAPQFHLRKVPIANRPNAIANSTAGQNANSIVQRHVLTNSSLLTNNLSSPSLGTMHASSGQTSKTPNPVKPPLGTLGKRTSATAPMRLSDTIDLTVEPTTNSGMELGLKSSAVTEQSSNAVSIPCLNTPGRASNAAVNHSGSSSIRPQHTTLSQAITAPKTTPSIPRASHISNHIMKSQLDKPRQLPGPSPRPAPPVVTQNPFPVAPLPPIPPSPWYTNGTSIQSAPLLTIAEAAEGICLQWTIARQTSVFEPAAAYEIYSYASSELTASNLHTHLPWKKVGEVAALPLPMACTLTHVQSNNLYYFAVRSFDRYRRYSSWSNVVNAVVS